MIRRLLKISKKRSFFLFGARGTGKSTLIKNNQIFNKHCLKIDLLEPEQEEKYSLRPQALFEEPILKFILKKKSSLNESHFLLQLLQLLG
jgi:predicted AAA+ superfamily ATPase